MSKIKQISDRIKQQGLFPTLSKIFVHMLFYPAISPICSAKLNKTQGNTLAELANFAIDGCFGFFRPKQVKFEILELCELVRSRNVKSMLEIGTARGGSLMLLARCLDDNAKIISLDLPGGRFGGGYMQYRIPIYRKFLKQGQSIEFIRKDSHLKSTKEEIETILAGKKLDFLFIDGDHTYDGVKRDFELYKDLVKKGGMIAFHDIAEHTLFEGCEVDRFWNELKSDDAYDPASSYVPKAKTNLYPKKSLQNIEQQLSGYRRDYQSKEIIENSAQGWGGIGIIFID